jgi:transcriptional regulator with XRE-family HTH domain
MDGPSLARLRTSLNDTQEEFAKILGVSRASIARAEASTKLSRIIELSLDQALRDGRLREKKK